MRWRSAPIGYARADRPVRGAARSRFRRRPRGWRQRSAREAIREGLAGVAAINDDRLLRLYLAVIEAILRTNAFAPAANEALAFKIDSAQVPNLPRPVPWREIFVYSRRVEGIHLRAGPVARGGLRWSDRRDDFRTEVLGLMKAQRVKNAVIVPTGAKGGFYPKQLPDPATDREAWAAEGQASYEVFIRTLLSVTDNIVDDTVVHPDDVVRRDGDDPYFVVAADKGTARFSDIANAIAEDRDFWLDDAFASGGSNGYDHKAMGITARARGSRCSAISSKWAWMCRAKPSTWSAAAICRATCSATGCCCRGRSGWSRLRPPPYLHRPRARCGEELGRTQAVVRPAALQLGGLRCQADFEGRRRLRAQPEDDSHCRPKCANCWISKDETLDPDALISAILAAPVDLHLVRRHRHLYQGGVGK